MPSPRAVVIPFGVPDEGRGLGIGLAALVHACAHFDGESFAIAQLHARKKDDASDAPPGAVEAFVAPAAWNDLALRGDAPGVVHVVVTGALEPPSPGPGALHLLAYDPRDGQTRARVEARLDANGAGASLVDALESLWSGLGGDIGALGALRGLEWDPLESVLRAERCALFDPLRGTPHDRLAAMAHLGRAIGEAPEARYPAERLAALALETALRPGRDPKLTAAAVRALERASEDAPRHVELAEALSTLLLSLGRTREAEKHLRGALEDAPGRVRLHTLLAQCQRASGALDAALSTVRAAQAQAPGDVGLSTELGAVLAARGDLPGARAAWLEALERHPLHPAPYANLAALALRAKDTASAQSLIDAALDARVVHVDVLRGAVELSLASEADGIARASRVARLCTRVLEVMPGDLRMSLMLACAQLTRGEDALARTRLVEIERVAPASPAAAEAQLVLRRLNDPTFDAQLQSVARAADSTSPEVLAAAVSRGRALGEEHRAWAGWFVAARAERRLGRARQARACLDHALQHAPGAARAQTEMAEVLLELGEAPRALEHARLAVALDGESALGLALVARAERACGELVEPPAPLSRSWVARLGVAWRVLTQR